MSFHVDSKVMWKNGESQDPIRSIVLLRVLFPAAPFLVAGPEAAKGVPPKDQSFYSFTNRAWEPVKSMRSCRTGKPQQSIRAEIT
jgi:hypothetical protein